MKTIGCVCFSRLSVVGGVAWPLVATPQQTTAPSERAAHEWNAPALTFVYVMPNGNAGTLSCPALFWPQHATMPSLRSALALQFAFGVQANEIYPLLVAEIEDEVARRAVRLDEQLRERPHRSPEKVEAFLRDIVLRAGNTTLV